ncbi:MAG: thiamine pyrophosphate-binding protein [Chloroflexi bacterium]|nr:thiamine pyrophosphate-binding protein [Chloroflexota bacterium]MBV9595315.1 thiamine pyrophosphate-binding protein [Chloroflexota bacterium]
MKVFEGLAKAFAAEGTTSVFGMMGDGNMYWMEALHDLGVQLLEVRHEGAGLGMADGWARVTYSPGVCTATCGPGVTQLATALVTAARAQSGLVAFVGESPTDDEEYVQRFDQSRFAEACEAGFVRVLSPDTAYDAVRKAFYRAKLESRPILLSAPMDTQQKTMDDDEEYVPSSAILGSNRIQPNPDSLARAVDIIAGSSKPLIIVGRGAIRSGAGEAVVRLARRMGALIATTLMAKNWLSEEPYYVGISGFYGSSTAMELFQEADCVIGVGASLNRYTTEHGYLYPNARFIHIDTKPHVLMSGAKAADCYVQADARLGVESLDARLAERSFTSAGYRTPEVEQRLVNHHADTAEFPIEADRVDPREVCLTLDQSLPTDVQLVMGSGASTGFTTMLFNAPGRRVVAGHFFGCIGQMLPAAMGAIVATGNQPTLLVDGDASTMMHLAELETAVRYDMPLLVTVLNDQALGSEYHKMKAHDRQFDLATIPTPDLGAVARSFGGRGCLATHVEDVRTAAADWLANKGVMVIDARISRNVITVPYRRLHYGRDD